MIERSRRLRTACRSAVVLAFVAATLAPAAAPVAADARIAPRTAEGAASQTPFNLVKAAQRFLADQNYQPGPVDGIVGPKTRTAVMAWQRENGLETDGSLNSATLASMGLAPQ
jgi:peptidoglycan hydrolase-like protein with peptidoglycan-binding domain